MSSDGAGRRPRRAWRIALYLLHWAIIANFLLEIGYASYLVFVVLAPEGGGGALGARAREVPFELMVTRRLYATECWIAIAGLAIYLALTEIGPRLRAIRGGAE